jgi:hypothetical protein
MMSGREIENEPWGGQPAVLVSRHPFLVLVSLLALVGFHDSWARCDSGSVHRRQGHAGVYQGRHPGPLNTRSVDRHASDCENPSSHRG